MALYLLDKQLRQLMLDSIERIEVHVRIVIAHEVGYHDPLAYQKLTVMAQLTPETTLFIDDSAANVEAAAQAGYQTHMFTDNQALFKILAGITSGQ